MEQASDNQPSEDLDMQYALGLMDRDAYLQGRETALIKGPMRRPPLRGHRLAMRLAILGTILAVAVLILVLALLPAILSPPSISFSPPERIVQADLNATASEGAITTFYTNNTIWIGSAVSRIVVLASPPAHDEVFVILNLTNPTIHLSSETQLTLIIVNADPDAYHNLALTTTGPPFTQMPMMQMMNAPGTVMMSPPESGDYWAQEMHINSLSSGQYWYLCQYPDHAEEGMYGGLIVD